METKKGEKSNITKFDMVIVSFRNHEINHDLSLLTALKEKKCENVKMFFIKI